MGEISKKSMKRMHKFHNHPIGSLVTNMTLLTVILVEGKFNYFTELCNFTTTDFSTIEVLSR